MPSIEQLTSDKLLFDQHVYTSLPEARKLLDVRWADGSISVPKHVPPVTTDGSCALYSVAAITHNYEVMRFIWATEVFSLKPVIFERKEDRFIPQNNEWKRYLGKIGIHEKSDRNGKPIIRFENVIDFNDAVGRALSEINTLWGQPLIDFHRELFFGEFAHLSEKDNFFDNSDWFHEVGGTPGAYYDALLSLAVRHGILFENFMFSKSEMKFTKEVFLPAFQKVFRETGHKPLIVALEPSELEGDVFWLSHPSSVGRTVANRLASI